MKKIIAIASGKGGVGKSTLAANLAVSLANFAPEGSRPPKVALIDVDFYGPSIPTLMGGGECKVDANEKFIPALRHGVKFISIQFFLQNPDDPVIWRGPMFGKGINQLFNDVSWGEVDICLVDLPPGTGDAQLSLAQLVQLDGAVIVTTPQEVSLADVRKAVKMFDKVQVPVLGVVENMAGFKTSSGEVEHIFGQGGGEKLAGDYGLEFFGSIPIETAIREGGDTGKPAALAKDSCFHQIAEKLNFAVEKRAAETPQVKIMN
jgi:ATP-binding protein involved in chromosome partitioning